MSTSDPSDTREKMAEINARRDEIRAKIDRGDRLTEPAGSGEEIGRLATRLDGNGDVVAAPRADGGLTARDLQEPTSDLPAFAGLHPEETIPTRMGGFTVKDSGAREQYDSGMVRDTADGKIDYSLVLDGPMFDRWAEHMTKGATKYAKRNWMQANGQAELDRFRESALRHFLQWYRGELDEDHAAAIIFNVNGAEFVKAQEVTNV